MANTVSLKAANPNDVTSPQKVSVLTAEPNTWLLIYSGIALQRQRAEGDSGFLGIGESTSETEASVTVVLDNISGVLLQAATTASMSNIVEENTWGQWTIEDTGLTLQPNGDLVLHADTTVTGIGDAEFYAFYYYVSAKVILDEASISGTIRWRKDLTTPQQPPLFVITADTAVPGGPGEFGGLQVEATGRESAIEAADPTFYYVPYTITGPLLAKTVSVIVIPQPGRFSGGPPILLAEQIAGPTSITLTTAHRHEQNVNFELVGEQSPR